MEAGRGIDALVSAKVMGRQVAPGWRVSPGYGDDDYATEELKGYEVDDATPEFVISGSRGVSGLVPRYSTDIAAAWQVVDKLKEKGWAVWVGHEGGDWSFMCGPPNQHVLLPEADPAFCENASTAPLAICLTALATVNHSA